VIEWLKANPSKPEDDQDDAIVEEEFVDLTDDEKIAISDEQFLAELNALGDEEGEPLTEERRQAIDAEAKEFVEREFAAIQASLMDVKISQKEVDRLVKHYHERAESIRDDWAMGQFSGSMSREVTYSAYRIGALLQHCTPSVGRWIEAEEERRQKERDEHADEWVENIRMQMDDQRHLESLPPEKLIECLRLALDEVLTLTPEELARLSARERRELIEKARNLRRSVEETDV
jgi:hypothetical protein